MKREVRLDFSDKELERAVLLMLKFRGYGITENESAHDIPTVTDKSGAYSKKVIRIIKEDGTAERNVLHRPFDEDALAGLVDALFDNTEAEHKKSTVRIDRRRMTVTVDGVCIGLTDKEMQLFILLMQSKGDAVSDTEIEEKVFGAAVAQNSNIAAVYVNYLRKKLDMRLGKQLIFRIRGKGYALKIT